MARSDRVLSVEGLGALIHELKNRGFTVIAPTVRDGAIVNAPIESIDQLPRGVAQENFRAHRVGQFEGRLHGRIAGNQVAPVEGLQLA